MTRYSTILNGGSLAGLASFLLFLIYFYALDTNPLGGIKFIGIVVPIALMYFSVKRFKETEGEGFLTYGKGFIAGLLFTFVYSSLSAMFIYLFGFLIDGSFVDYFKEDNLKTLGETKDQLIGFLGESAYEEMIEEIQQIGLGDLAWSDFQSKTLAGLVIALIVAAIHKQNPPTFAEESE